VRQCVSSSVYTYSDPDEDTGTTMKSSPLYAIGTVARLTKINPDTLRVWERRYGLGPAQKSATGRRLYNQNELEHLQIVSALLASGYRIGEIATMERKTLDALHNRESLADNSNGKAEPTHLLVVGTELCGWLEHHRACLARMKCTLIARDLQDVEADALLQLQPVDLLMVGVEKASECDSRYMSGLRSIIGSPPTTVCHNSSKTATTTANNDILLVKGPMTVESFTTSIQCLKAKAELRVGDSDIARLSRPKSRLFSNQALEDIRNSPSKLACDCPSHLSGLIEALTEFESYSSECAVENWSDAATHACVYAYANQARWLLEKALTAATSEHH